MSLRLRRIMVGVSIVLFLTALGPILFYTFGYRFSFTDKSISKTGGLFINTTPVRAVVRINTTWDTTSFITGDLFMQNLRPGLQSITVEKDGYYTWKKNLLIKPQEVAEAHIVLIPKHGATTTLVMGDFTLKDGSSSGRYIILEELRNKDTRKLRIFDTQTKLFLNSISFRENIFLTYSSKTEPTFKWYKGDTIAIGNLTTDWILITPTSGGTVSVESLYAQSKLSKLLPQKPEKMIPHPIEKNSYFVLSDTSLYIWRSDSGTLQSLLKTISGIAVDENTLISLDTVRGNVYVSTLAAGNAKIVSTWSIPSPALSDIYETLTSYIIHDDKMLWLMSKDGHAVESLANAIPSSRIRTNGINIVWWNDNEIWIRWTMPEKDLPYFQEDFQSRIYETNKRIKQVSYYPREQYIIFTEDNAVKVMELDGRSDSRNVATLYEGVNPSIFIPKNEKTAYILDNGILFSMRLE